MSLSRLQLKERPLLIAGNSFIGNDFIRTIQGQDCSSGSKKITSANDSGKKKFNPVMGESYIINTEGKATVKLYSITGRLVRELNSERDQVVWNGTDGNGNFVVSGVYIIEIRKSSGETKSQKVIVVK